MGDENIKGTKRAPNFTSMEKIHLLTIIRNKYTVIEDKKTDRSSIIEKNLTWKKIELDFNSSSPNNIYRSAECLKKFYENRKKDLRKHVAEEKKQRMLTGGGPMPAVKKDDGDEILISIVNEKTINGLPSKYDSDSVNSPITINNKHSDIEYEFILDDTPVENRTESNVQLIEEVSICENEKSDVINIEESETWKNYTPVKLRTPINPALNVTHTNIGEPSTSHSKSKRPLEQSRRRPTKTIRTLTSSDVSMKYNLLLDKRLVLVEKQIQQLEDERGFQRQKQQLKLEILKIDLALKKQNLPPDLKI